MAEGKEFLGYRLDNVIGKWIRKKTVAESHSPVLAESGISGEHTTVFTFWTTDFLIIKET